MCSIDPELGRELEKAEYWLWNDAVRMIKENTEELRSKKKEIRNGKEDDTVQIF